MRAQVRLKTVLFEKVLGESNPSYSFTKSLDKRSRARRSISIVVRKYPWGRSVVWSISVGVLGVTGIKVKGWASVACTEGFYCLGKQTVKLSMRRRCYAKRLHNPDMIMRCWRKQTVILGVDCFSTPKDDTRYVIRKVEIFHKKIWASDPKTTFKTISCSQKQTFHRCLVGWVCELTWTRPGACKNQLIHIPQKLVDIGV